MKKVFTKKFITLLLSIIAEILMVVAVMVIGFKTEMKTYLLPDLVKPPFENVDFAQTSYYLILSGLIFGALSVIVILVSTFLGRLFFFLDWVLWFVGIAAFLLALILMVAGEAYFVTQLPKSNGFSYDKGVFAGVLVCTILPSILTIGMGIASFSKPKQKK